MRLYLLVCVDEIIARNNDHANQIAVKRILRCLKGTVDYGLFLNQQLSTSSYVFVDVDWAGNVDDKTSTSAYVIFLGANPFSWS
ncbi:hypothetical protein Peur_008536 [Populus x canadensis]